MQSRKLIKSLQLCMLVMLILTMESGWALIWGSDHSAISFKLIVDFEIPNITFSRKVYLKFRVDRNGVFRDISNIDGV